jgi:hypothetical protein
VTTPFDTASLEALRAAFERLCTGFEALPAAAASRHMCVPSCPTTSIG